MISSVIARLSPGETNREKLINEISIHPCLEVGELIDNRLLPITIDAAGKSEMEETTRWLQDRESVEFVDVVFVHLEDE